MEKNSMEVNSVKTVGIIKSKYKTEEQAPSQGRKNISEIEVMNEYIDGLKDIETFSHLHIFYLLDKSKEFSLSVTTPWDRVKHGVFSTRSPNRPTPLGYSVVELIERKDNVLRVKGLDAIDGTPVLDIKPYISKIDSVPIATRGWFDNIYKSFTPRVYEYKTVTEWKHEKEGILRGDKKHDVRIGCPPEFGGKDVYWSAEHLFVASVEVCIMTTFLDNIAKEDIAIDSYKSSAVGKAQLVDGIFRFNALEVKIELVIGESVDEGEIKSILYRSKDECMVSNTLVIDVVMDTKIRRK
jgi:tRNA-Thr(GGU) m(6)t(6)A37 methyltransferase TsaA